MQISQMSRINTNNCVCHSEHSEESREGKGKEIHRSALNDKLVVNGYAWYTVSERRGTSPQPPFKKGGKNEAKGGCYPFKGGMQCGQPSAFSI